MTPPPFFIGWSGRVERGLRGFLVAIALGVFVAAAGFALLLAAGARDHAPRDFARGTGATPIPLGAAAVEGVLTLDPAPVLHVAPTPEWPSGRAILLAGAGKYAPPVELDPLEGQRISVTGYHLWRGSIEMLAGDDPPTPAPGPAVAPRLEPQGRWRLTGEICDGKCAGSGMVPGSGLAHRACATLCIDGDLPALFVTTAPVLGEGFLLLGAIPPELRRWIGLRVTMDGAVERLGAVLVFRPDPMTVVVAR